MFKCGRINQLLSFWLFCKLYGNVQCAFNLGRLHTYNFNYFFNKKFIKIKGNEIPEMRKSESL